MALMEETMSEDPLRRKSGEAAGERTESEETRPREEEPDLPGISFRISFESAKSSESKRSMGNKCATSSVEAPPGGEERATFPTGVADKTFSSKASTKHSAKELQTCGG